MRGPSAAAIMATLLVIGAGSVAAAQSPPASPGSDAARVEVPEAGIALTVPGDWEVRVPLVRHPTELPPELEEAAEAYTWDVVEAVAPDGRGCRMLMYEGHPLPLPEHVDWITRAYDETPGLVDEIGSTPVGLPIGDATRLDIAFTEGGLATGYVFATDQGRYQLQCGGDQRPDDDWRSVAETIESIPMASSGRTVPDVRTLADGVDIVRDFPTVVSVVDPSTPGFPEASLMSADCDFALHIAAADGTAKEWLACTLNDEPVEPPEQQGTRPTSLVITTGGPCIWQSDYWMVSSRTQVPASSFEIYVTPGGQVFGWSTYPTEPLDCAPE